MRSAVIGVVVACALVGCRGAYGVPSERKLDPTREPSQSAEPSSAASLVVEGAERFRITPLARYDITARVLHRERYYLGWQSELSPLDLALGWGDMADPAVDRFIDWYQGGRWYFFHWSADSPYQNREISLHSANVHIVPANANLRRALLSIGRDQTLALSGHLIRAARDGDPDAVWQSSLSRDDTGDGSCELLYVERLVSGGLDYQ